MKTIYNTILELLENQVSELKWVDEQKGQMQYERPPVAFPAALLDITFPKTENITKTIQKGQCVMNIDFCFDYTGNMTSSAYSRPNREKSLQHWDIVNKAHTHLQGFESEHFNELERVSVGDRLKRPGYKVITATYIATFREDLN